MRPEVVQRHRGRFLQRFDRRLELPIFVGGDALVDQVEGHLAHVPGPAGQGLRRELAHDHGQHDQQGQQRKKGKEDSCAPHQFLVRRPNRGIYNPQSSPDYARQPCGSASTGERWTAELGDWSSAPPFWASPIRRWGRTTRCRSSCWPARSAGPGGAPCGSPWYAVWATWWQPRCSPAWAWRSAGCCCTCRATASGCRDWTGCGRAWPAGASSRSAPRTVCGACATLFGAAQGWPRTSTTGTCISIAVASTRIDTRSRATRARHSGCCSRCSCWDRASR